MTTPEVMPEDFDPPVYVASEVASATDAAIDNVDVDTAANGYAADTYLFRIRDGLDGCTINDVTDVNGSVIYQSPATGSEPTKYVFTNCPWI